MKEYSVDEFDTDRNYHSIDGPSFEEMIILGTHFGGYGEEEGIRKLSVGFKDNAIIFVFTGEKDTRAEIPVYPGSKFWLNLIKEYRKELDYDPKPGSPRWRYTIHEEASRKLVDAAREKDLFLRNGGARWLFILLLAAIDFKKSP